MEVFADNLLGFWIKMVGWLIEDNQISALG